MPPWCIPFVGLRPCSRPSIPRRGYVLHPARECLKIPHEELERVAVQRDVRKTLQTDPDKLNIMNVNANSHTVVTTYSDLYRQHCSLCSHCYYNRYQSR